MSKLEICARAIYGPPGSWEWSSLEAAIACRRAVRLVLEALKEPSPDMIVASSKALKHHIENLSPYQRKRAGGTKGLRIKRGEKARIRFNAMIDAVLKEGT